MSSTSPPPNILSAFTPLTGGYSQAIAPGIRIVTLGGAGATWWEGGVPVTVPLPNLPSDGTQWTANGKALHVGLGTIDLASRTWNPEPSLAHWNMPGPQGDTPVKAVAWFEGADHVALLLESRSGGTRATEIVVTSATDGRARGRRVIEGASALVATADRLMVAGQKVVLLDLDANVVAEPAGMPLSVLRVRKGAGTFAALGAAGSVALVRPADGAVLGTWDVRAVDAVPMPGGVVAVAFDGKVNVGCLEGDTVRTVAQVESGVAAPVIQIVGDKVVVAGAGANPVRMATLVDPCRRTR